MRNRQWIIRVIGALALLAGAGLGWADEDQAFEPYVSQARELIGGKEAREVTIPVAAAELKTYNLKPEQAKELVTQIPGKSPRQVTPAPMARAWWNYPLYAVVGFPRDVVDSFFGALSYVPGIGLPLVWVPYEFIPTQALFRDPRDWHRWMGYSNARGHGMVDGTSWGFFPSFNSWTMTYPSPRLARKNAIFNENLRKEIQESNKKIEETNQTVSYRTRDVRTKALAAIQAGNGREAAMRMIAYQQAFPLDEGAFALYVTALALYLPDGPEWVAPLLWEKLNAAQPKLLNEASKLMAATLSKEPEQAGLAQALIYTRLLAGQEDTALMMAQAIPAGKISPAQRLQLVFETALAARDKDAAAKAWTALQAESYDAAEKQMMGARLELLKGQYAPAMQVFSLLYQKQPEDPYLNYYVGVGEIMGVQQAKNPAETVHAALSHLERAELTAPGLALKAHAGQALAYTRGIAANIAAHPELFPGAKMENLEQENQKAPSVGVEKEKPVKKVKSERAREKKQGKKKKSKFTA